MIDENDIDPEKARPDKDVRGRKCKLTAEIIKEIQNVLLAGNYLDTAAAVVGISTSTLMLWLKTGRRERQRVTDNPRLRIRSDMVQFVLLSDTVRRSMAISEINDLEIIRKAARGGHTITEVTEEFDAQGRLIRRKAVTKMAGPEWTASAWRLERRRTEKWGRRVSISRDDKKVDETNMTPESKAAKIRDELAGFFGDFCAGEVEDAVVTPIEPHASLPAPNNQ